MYLDIYFNAGIILVNVVGDLHFQNDFIGRDVVQSQAWI